MRLHYTYVYVRISHAVFYKFSSGISIEQYLHVYV